MFETKRTVNLRSVNVPQGLAGHRRPQVRSANAHVDDILDLLTGVPDPLAAADSPCKAGHLVEHRRTRGMTFSRHRRRSVCRAITGRVQYGSILGGVDLLAGEHPLDRGGQVDRFGQGDEQPHGLVGDPVLRIVEPQPARLDHEPIRAARVFAKKVGQVQRLDGNEVLFEILPGRLLVESHHDRLCFPSGQRFGSPRSMKDSRQQPSRQRARRPPTCLGRSQENGLTIGNMVAPDGFPQGTTRMENLELIRSLKIPADTNRPVGGRRNGGLPIEEREVHGTRGGQYAESTAWRKGSAAIRFPSGREQRRAAVWGHLGCSAMIRSSTRSAGACSSRRDRFAVGPNDVAVRCNFCTIDAQGKITDRRAGRIPTRPERACAAQPGQHPRRRNLRRTGPEHRFVAIFRGEGLGGDVADTDPKDGRAARSRSGQRGSERTAEVAIQFVEKLALLAGEAKANCLSMRGFARRPDLPSYEEVYGLKAAAIAAYPMYKGLASLVGMEVVGKPANLSEEIDVLEKAWNDYDFFFVHFKYTDSRGEDGNFEAKVKMIEQFDSVVPRIEALKPNVLIVTGDHSTPAAMASHSWHPVPTLLVGDHCRPDACQKFGEREALLGGLGHFEALHLMPIAMAHAGRLAKFGA